jgi:hypothetical protein
MNGRADEIIKKSQSDTEVVTNAIVTMGAAGWTLAGRCRCHQNGSPLDWSASLTLTITAPPVSSNRQTIDHKVTSPAELQIG